MRAVSSGTGGTGCGRRSDKGDLWTRKSSNAHPTPWPLTRLPISPTVSDRIRAVINRLKSSLTKLGNRTNLNEAANLVDWRPTGIHLLCAPDRLQQFTFQSLGGSRLDAARIGSL